MDMDSISPVVWLALVAGALFLTAYVVARQLGGNKGKPKATREALDTVIAWPPEATRVLSVAERQAYDLLRRAMPSCLVLAQVPLSRFIRVPTRHSYGDWLQRVGSLNADLLLCDSGSKVLAVVDIRGPSETPRSRRRHERMERVLKAAKVPVYNWREADLPVISDIRNSMATLLPAPAASLPTPSQAMPLDRPNSGFAESQRSAPRSIFDPAMEPVSSAFVEDFVPTQAPR
jgi:Protein of unknown function (DUF2726)